MNYSTDNNNDVCDEMYDNNTSYINKVRSMFKKLKRDEGDIYDYYMEYDNTLSIYKVKVMFKHVKNTESDTRIASEVREIFKRLKN